MSKVMLRNVSPLGYVDVREIGRVGAAPEYKLTTSTSWSPSTSPAGRWRPARCSR
jgi:hypothetical protein